MSATRAPLALLLACATSALLAAGCGGGGSGAPTVTPTPSASRTATASPTPTAVPPSATASPSATPTPTDTAAPTATATLDDTLPAALDNGADGLNPFNDPTHVRPVDACADAPRASADSLVIRLLPRGPLTAGGDLAFTAGVCVYLPPGYLDSGLDYPVLYLLHGGGGDQANWVGQGGVRATMDALIAADAANAALVVMPDGSNGQWYDAFDGSLQNQRYVLDFVIPYVERHLRVIAARDGRAIAGLSNGGYGALHLAAKAPDRFVAAGAMSSNIAGLSFAGLAAGTAPAFARGSLPVDLAPNLDAVDLTMDIGTECIGDRAIDNCLTWNFEQIFVPANRAFRDRVLAVRAGAGVLEYREGEGAHAWRWWSRWLRERHLPFLLARLADPRPVGEVVAPPPPAVFRYRSIAPAFSVWGYEVRVERGVREFLDLSAVDAGGLVVQGSGRVEIVSAPRHQSFVSYTVRGAGPADQHALSDGEGRIAFSVDLGPSHVFEQFTPQADAAEAAGGYWTVREVAIERVE